MSENRHGSLTALFSKFGLTLLSQKKKKRIHEKGFHDKFKNKLEKYRHNITLMETK